jgi:hypothetical protein
MYVEHNDILPCGSIRLLNSMNFTDGDNVKTYIIIIKISPQENCTAFITKKTDRRFKEF